MKQTSWPDVTPINQKNYYTYVKHRHLRGMIRGVTAWSTDPSYLTAIT